MKPMPSVNASSSTPVSQFISRGNLYEPARNTWAMCMPTISTIADAP